MVAGPAWPSGTIHQPHLGAWVWGAVMREQVGVEDAQRSRGGSGPAKVVASVGSWGPAAGCTAAVNMLMTQ